MSDSRGHGRIAGRRLVLPALIGAAAFVSLVGAGRLYGYWVGVGGGAGAGAHATTLDVILTPGTAAATLFPGARADVVLSVVNPNPFAVHLESFALDPGHGVGGFDVDESHSGCDPLSTLNFGRQTNGTSGWEVSAGGLLSVTLTDAVTMSIDALSECQGANFTVYLAADQ